MILRTMGTKFPLTFFCIVEPLSHNVQATATLLEYRHYNVNLTKECNYFNAKLNLLLWDRQVLYMCLLKYTIENNKTKKQTKLNVTKKMCFWDNRFSPLRASGTSQ